MPEVMDQAQQRTFEDFVGAILQKNNVEGDAKTIADKIIEIAKSRANKTSFGSFCYIDPAEIEEMVVNNAELSLKLAEEKRIAKEKEEAKLKEKEELKKKEALEKKLEKERKTSEGEQLTLDMELFGGGL